MSFRLMQRVERDERVVSEHASYEEAAAALEDYAKAACVYPETLPQVRSELSLWEVGGRIVGVVDPRTHALKRVPSRGAAPAG